MEKFRKAQSTIEFTFGVIVVMFIIYGMVHVFRWAGMDLAQRRYAMDSSMTMDVVVNADNPNGDPAVQLNGDFGRVLPIGGVYRGSITTSGN